MKKVWNIFKEHFLTYYVIILVYLVVSYFAVANKNFKTIFYVTIFFFLLATALGIIDFFRYEYFRPKKVEKMLNKSPFVDFQRNGFKRNGNEFKGKIRGYSIKISLIWEDYQKEPNYCLEILYHPKSYNRFLRKDEHIKFSESLKNQRMIFFICAIRKNYSKGWFVKLRFNKILNDINIGVDFLKSRKLLPIDFQEWEDYLPKVMIQEEKFDY